MPLSQQQKEALSRLHLDYINGRAKLPKESNFHKRMWQDSALFSDIVDGYVSKLIQEKVEKIEKELELSYMKGSPASYVNKGLHKAITILKE